MQLTCVDLDPSATWLAVGARDGLLSLWPFDAPAQAAPRRLAGHAGAVSRVRISGDGSRVVSAGLDGAAIVWRTVPVGR